MECEINETNENVSVLPEDCPLRAETCRRITSVHNKVVLTYI